MTLNLQTLLSDAGQLSQEEYETVIESVGAMARELKILQITVANMPPDRANLVYASVVGSILFGSWAGPLQTMNSHHYTNLMAAYARHCHDEFASGGVSPLGTKNNKR